MIALCVLSLLAGRAQADEPQLSPDELRLSPDELRLTAREMLWDDGRLQGGPEVVVRWGEERIRARAFELLPDEPRLRLWEGEWQRPEGLFRFEELAIVGGPPGEPPRAQAAAVELRGEELWLRAEALVVEGGARLVAEQLVLSPCGCAPRPWGLFAREAELDERLVRLRGARLLLCERPTLPLPALRYALRERQAGLLPPVLGRVEDGWRLGLPVYLPLGAAADLSLGPEWYGARGLRLPGQARAAVPGGEGSVEGAVGFDRMEGRGRGFVDASLAWADGPWEVALEGTVAGDRAYLEDYGESYETRGLPWTESRLRLAHGGAGLLLGSIQALGETADPAQRLVAGRLRSPILELPGPLRAETGLGLDLWGEGPQAWQAAPRLARAEAELRLSAPVEAGPLRLLPEARLSTAAHQLLDEEAASARLRGEAAVAVELPTWAAWAHGLLVGEWGLRGAVEADRGELEAPWTVEEESPPWRVGPTVNGRLRTSSGLALRGGAALYLEEAGPQPEAWLQAQPGDLEIRAQLDPRLQWLDLRVPAGLVQGAFGLARADGLLQTRSRLDLQAASVLVGYRLDLDVEEGRVLRQGPRLGWDPGCGCLRLDAELSWFADQRGPTAALSLELR